MKRIKLLVVLTVIVLAGLALASLFWNPKISTESKSYKAITVLDNGVEIQVRPLTLESGRKAVFQVFLNTHFGSLDIDLVQAATLYDDYGTAMKPQKWDGPPVGGHHRSGTLSFDLNKPTKVLKLVVPLNKENTFEWRLD